MSCNCPTPNQCPPSELCLCGVTLTISNSDGSIVETLQGNIFQGEGDYYYVAIGSTIFNGILPTGYELTISYNYELERWEMTYFNEELGLTILLGVLYGVGPGDCPTNNCWDLDCNAVAFNVLGVFDTYFPWTGEYTNGKKSYTFSSDWSGPVINYRIYWIADSSTVPGTGAPVGTPAWILEEEVGLNVWQPAGYLFNDNQCPYGQYLAEFGGLDTRYSFTDLGVTGFDMKSVATDCGCCDTELIVTINGTEYTAEVEYDEYGNILGYNGKQYYVFLYEGDEYYVYFNGTNWVIATDCGGAYRITEDGQPRITENLNYRIIE